MGSIIWSAARALAQNGRSGPRLAIVAVTLWKALPPLPLNPNWTSGPPPESVLSTGFEISLPNRATWSLRT